MRIPSIYIYPCRTSCPKSSTCFFFSDISIFLGRKCSTRFFFSDISIFSNLYARYRDIYAGLPWIRQPIDILPRNRGLLLNQQRRERPVFSRLGARRIGESLLNQQRRERPVFSRLGARRIGESLLNQQRREKPVFSN